MTRLMLALALVAFAAVAAHGETLTMTPKHGVAVACPSQQSLDKASVVMGRFNGFEIAKVLESDHCTFLNSETGPYEATRDNATSKYCQVVPLTLWTFCRAMTSE
jgi:hypothetical protein